MQEQIQQSSWNPLGSSYPVGKGEMKTNSFPFNEGCLFPPCPSLAQVHNTSALPSATYTYGQPELSPPAQLQGVRSPFRGATPHLHLGSHLWEADDGFAEFEG